MNVTQENGSSVLQAIAVRRAEKLRVLVLSDTHGSVFAYERALRLCAPVDIAVHLGDVVSDAKALEKMLPEGVPCIYVRGNCDSYNAAPDEAAFTIGGVHILAVHGHEDGVKYDLNNLYYHALEQHASVALYGHTHVSQVQRQGGVWLVNPGSASRPRYGRQISCAVLEIQNGKVCPGIVPL
jgi:putative phosphoesterase